MFITAIAKTLQFLYNLKWKSLFKYSITWSHRESVEIIYSLFIYTCKRLFTNVEINCNIIVNKMSGIVVTSDYRCTVRYIVTYKFLKEFYDLSGNNLFPIWQLFHISSILPIKSPALLRNRQRLWTERSFGYPLIILQINCNYHTYFWIHIEINSDH